MTQSFRGFGLLLAAIPAIGQVPSAADLLAKAQSAFDRNLAQEKHWNWTTTQIHTVLDGSGRELLRLPDVTVESVIRQDGRRCNAVLSWGDGVAPYKLNEDADARCRGQDPVEPPLRVASLLQSAKASLAGDATIAIHHDKAHVHDAAPEARCTASVEATIRLDPATFFPMYLEGQLVDSGCESDTVVELHYEDQPVTRTTRRALFKDTTFRIAFTRQPDKSGDPSKSYWISTEQHWTKPIQNAAGIIVFNRRFDLQPVAKSRVIVEESRTTAQEFGAHSLTRFDTIPK
jgi:hypothetical protein